MSKDEIIDSLKNYIDSISHVQNQVDKINQNIPQSIVILNKDVTIKNGYFTEIIFRVNPSDTELDIKSFILDNDD